MSASRSLTEQRMDRARLAGRTTQYWLVRALMVLAVVAWASTISTTLTRMFTYLNGLL
ncbi:MAG: hypothetical protein ABSC95_17645 [Acetobacteraceae bacterium]|jgi:hypothetical protein